MSSETKNIILKEIRKLKVIAFNTMNQALSSQYKYCEGRYDAIKDIEGIIIGVKTE